MKRKLFLFVCMFCIIFFSGCGKSDEKDVLKKIKQKMENSNSYNLQGDLEIMNAEYVYEYNVDVSYQKEDKFRVSLKNKTNNHEQIILKNQEGVFVLTPSLNKSFKFQSDWPYNNSQSYLIQNLIKDIEGEDTLFEKKGEEYIYTTKVNYANNKDLTKQKIYINKDLDFTKVEVYNDSEELKMKMIFKNIKFDENFNDDYFDLKSNMSVSEDIDSKAKTVSKINDIIYPMYIPANTYLTGQNVINKENGERVILTFSGEKPFVFVQETANYEKEPTTITMSGDPLLLTDTIGALSSNSASWVSNNVEYYLASDTLTQDELVSVVKSVSVMPVSK